MGLEAKVRLLFRSGHPATDISEGKSLEPVEVKRVRGTKPGIRV